MPDPKTGLTERHIQTIGAAVIIALVLWVGDSVSTNTATLATLSERSSHQTEQITEMKQTLTENNRDQYTRADARSDKLDITKQFAGFELRLREVEAKVK